MIQLDNMRMDMRYFIYSLIFLTGFTVHACPEQISTSAEQAEVQPQQPTIPVVAPADVAAIVQPNLTNEQVAAIVATAPFPNPLTITADDGLAAVLPMSVENLISAYYMGLFPWHDDGVNAKWYTLRGKRAPEGPNEFIRAIIDFKDFEINRGMRRFMAKTNFRVSFDRAFEQVFAACAAQARPGQAGTWIEGNFAKYYPMLHKAGFAHSVEVWDGEELVGGLFGVYAGGVFSGDSAFFKKDNAAKFALVHLVERLKQQGHTWVDIQMITGFSAPFGAKYVTREEHIERLQRAHELNLPF